MTVRTDTEVPQNPVEGFRGGPSTAEFPPSPIAKVSPTAEQFQAMFKAGLYPKFGMLPDGYKPKPGALKQALYTLALEAAGNPRGRITTTETIGVVAPPTCAVCGTVGILEQHGTEWVCAWGIHAVDYVPPVKRSHHKKKVPVVEQALAPAEGSGDDET